MAVVLIPMSCSSVHSVSRNQRPSCNLWRPYTEEQMPHVPSAWWFWISDIKYMVPGTNVLPKAHLYISYSTSSAVFCILLSKTLKRILLAWLTSAIVRWSSQRTVPLTVGMATKIERFQSSGHSSRLRITLHSLQNICTIISLSTLISSAGNSSKPEAFPLASRLIASWTTANGETFTSRSAGLSSQSRQSTSVTDRAICNVWFHTADAHYTLHVTKPNSLYSLSRFFARKSSLKWHLFASTARLVPGICGIAVPR